MYEYDGDDGRRASGDGPPLLAPRRPDRMRLTEERLGASLKPLRAVGCIRPFDVATVDDQGQARVLVLRPVDVLLLDAAGARPQADNSWSGKLKRDGYKARSIDIPVDCVVPIVPLRDDSERVRSPPLGAGGDAAQPEPEPEPAAAGTGGLQALELSTQRLHALPRPDAAATALGTLDADHAGGVIVCCDLRNNRLASGKALSMLSALPELESVDLSVNCIKTADGLPSLSQLRHLDLKCNRLEKFSPGLTNGETTGGAQWLAPKLCSLDLSANMLSEFDVSATALPALCRLNLSNNRLVTLIGLRKLEALVELDGKLHTQFLIAARCPRDAF